MDKMREEFESWAKDNTKMPLDYNGDYYNKADAYFAYLGWQASRAALKVELPATCNRALLVADGYDVDMIHDEYFEVDDIKQMLTDAGIGYE